MYDKQNLFVYEEKELLVEPWDKALTEGKSRLWLECGGSYLVKDQCKKAYKVFFEHILYGYEGLCITREFPPRVRQRYGLKNPLIIWLTEEEVKGETTIYSLLDVSLSIRQFLNKNKTGVVLLDGIEYLIINHGFEPFIRFLQLTRNRFEYSNCFLIAPIEEEALDLKQAKLIEREMKPLRVE